MHDPTIDQVLAAAGAMGDPHRALVEKLRAEAGGEAATLDGILAAARALGGAPQVVVETAVRRAAAEDPGTT